MVSAFKELETEQIPSPLFSGQRTFTKHILCAQTCLGPVTKSKFRHLPFGHYLQNRTAEAKKASDVLGKGNNTPAAPSLWKLV